MDLSNIQITYPKEPDKKMMSSFYQLIHANTAGSVALAYRDKKWHQYVCKDENVDFSKINPSFDSYVTVNDLYISSKDSTSQNVSYVNAMFFDLDIHGEDNETVDNNCSLALDILDEKIKSGEFPNSQAVVLTGRGIGLYVVYNEPVDTNDDEEIEKHEVMYRVFCNRLASFLKEYANCDTSVLNQNRVCRIPGTLNTKAQRYSSLVFLNDEELLAVDELFSFVKKDEIVEQEVKVERGTNAVIKSVCSDVFVTVKLANEAHFLLRKLDELLTIRCGLKGEMRQNTLFVFYNLKRLFVSEDEAMEATFEINSSFADPLTRGEVIDCVINHTNRHTEKGVWAGRKRCHSDGVYTFSKEKFCDILKIDEYEKTKLNLYKWKNYKEEIKINKIKKQETKELAFDLRREGVSVSEIMKKTGKTRDTLYRWFKEEGLDKKTFKHTRRGRKVCKMSDFLPNNNVYSNNNGGTCGIFADASDNGKITMMSDADTQKAYELLRQGKNVLLHGKAGTGKTTLLERFIKENEENGLNVVKIAATGLAASNIGGTTAHSFFGLSIREYEPSKIPVAHAVEALKNADILVIDEIGTFRFDYFAEIAKAVDKAKKKYRKKIQVVLSGDFLQTFPVVTKKSRRFLTNMWEMNIGTGHAFKAKKAWESLNLEFVCLNTVYRQTEADFSNALDKARIGDTTCSQFFDNLDKVDYFSDFGVHICPHRSSAEEINHHFEDLYKLTGKYTTYTCGGKSITLVVGAPVVAVKNTRKFKNGEMGTVTKLNKKSISVSFGGRAPVRVTPLRDYDNGGYYIPLMLAHALTVHKAQGKTFDKAIIHTDFFEDGMAYVAFSRVRTKDGIKVAGNITNRTFERNKKLLDEVSEIMKG